MERLGFVDPSLIVESSFLPTSFPREGEIFNPPTIYRFDRKFTADHMDDMVSILLDVTCDATGLDPEWMMEDQRNGTRGWDYILALVQERVLLGYGGFKVFDVPGFGQIFGEGAMMIRKSRQGNKYAQRLAASAVSQHPDVKYFHLTTQNPASYLSFKKGMQMAGIETAMAPIDLDFQDDPELSALLGEIVKDKKRQDIDPVTGLWPRLYGGRRLGDYDVDLARPEVSYVNDRMLNVGLDRENGDAIYFLGKRIYPEQP